MRCTNCKEDQIALVCNADGEYCKECHSELYPEDDTGFKFYQQKLMKEFESMKEYKLLDPLTKATIVGPMFLLLAKAYKKGHKRAKYEINELINQIKP